MAATDIAGDATLDAQREIFRANKALLDQYVTQMDQRRAQTHAQMRGGDAQMQALRAQLALVQPALQRQRALLGKGLAQAASVLEFERETSQLHGTLASLLADRSQWTERLGEIEIETLSHIAQARQRALEKARALEEPIRRLRHEIETLKTRIVDADIRAPVAGIVHQLAVHTDRAVVRPADPILAIVPQDRPRIVVAQVMPRDIDRVSVAQQVEVRLANPDAARMSGLAANIVRISPDAIADPRGGGTFFRIEVSVDAKALSTLPEGLALLPGMQVETFIKTGDRSPLVYLTQPIASYFARAFRES